MDGTTAMGEALEALRLAVDAALEADLDGVGAVEFAELLTSFEVQRRRVEAVDVRLLAGADASHVAGHFCRSSLSDLLVQQLRVSPGEARARVRRARDLGPRRALTGEPLSPTHPVLAAAQRAGEISTQHIDIATHAIGRIPSDIACEATGPVEQYLVEAARHETPSQLSNSAELILLRLDPDGTLPKEPQVAAGRNLRLSRKPDTSWGLSGSLTDETGLVWKTILDAVSKPKPSDDGMPETRTPEQRMHDGLRDLGIRILQAGMLPDAGGVATTVVLYAEPSDLAEPDGLCRTAYGHVMRTGSLRFLLADAELVPLLFDRTYSDCRLMLGRTQRFANRAQRRALAGRDGGCSFPGCDAPASWCDSHHIIAWVDDGRTDIDNLTLLCGFHHREFERRGWSCLMIDGLPHWVPPRWLDPDQTPRVNTAHHLPEIVFDPGGGIHAVRR